MTPVLFWHQERLCLGLPGQADAGILYVDFFDAGLLHRIRRGVSGESVVKATGARPVGIPAHPGPQKLDQLHCSHHLIDATCGLGLDAFILALAGWQVTMVEQSPVIHALLEDGLKRATERARVDNNAGIAAALARMCLLPAADSKTLLPALPSAAVVYLDPMFPDRDKSARVKKNRFLLQQLHGDEADGSNLLALALARARKVVVKRPVHAAPLDGVQPSGSIVGKTARFDIYAGHAVSVTNPANAE